MWEGGCFKFEKTLIQTESRDRKCCFCRLKLWSGLSVEEVQRTCAFSGSEGLYKVGYLNFVTIFVET